MNPTILRLYMLNHCLLKLLLVSRHTLASYEWGVVTLGLNPCQKPPFELWGKDRFQQKAVFTYNKLIKTQCLDQADIITRPRTKISGWFLGHFKTSAIFLRFLASATSSAAFFSAAKRCCIPCDWEAILKAWYFWNLGVFLPKESGDTSSQAEQNLWPSLIVTQCLCKWNLVYKPASL